VARLDGSASRASDVPGRIRRQAPRVRDPATAGRAHRHPHLARCLACRRSTEAHTIEERPSSAGDVARTVSRERHDACRRVGTDIPSGCLGRSRLSADPSMGCDMSASTVETRPMV
jgi:hypothetical protein